MSDKKKKKRKEKKEKRTEERNKSRDKNCGTIEREMVAERKMLIKREENVKVNEKRRTKGKCSVNEKERRSSAPRRKCDGKKGKLANGQLFWMDNFSPSQYHVENWRDGERRDALWFRTV